jgi:large-conductance mechanosensitive channel
LIFIVAAALLLEAMGAAQYFLATYGTEAELLDKAARDMEESQRVAAVKSEVETALRNIQSAVEMSVDNPKGYYRIAAGLVKNNPHIVGAGSAFRPDYYKSKGLAKLYAPYVYDRQPDIKAKKKKTTAAMVTATLLPFDYTTREWFSKTIEDGKSMWTQPYLDQGGTHIIMCTYVMPIEDRSGMIVGVFFADVPMEDVSVLSMEIHKGIINCRTVLFFIQVISLLIICFIVWLAVRAFRRYKGQYVDPEKDHLVEQMAKLREVNTRLTKRNQDLAEKLADLRQRMAADSQTTDTNWYR